MKYQIPAYSHCLNRNTPITGLPLCLGGVFFMEKEIWKTIKGYPDYEVSSFGGVKSLGRLILKYGKKPFLYKERILKPVVISGGYLAVNLYSNGVVKMRTIHQLVAEAFLNHKPNGHKLVVNHINFNKADNRVKNIEIITQRENTNQKHIKSSSKYTGVTWYKTGKKWVAKIHINGKDRHLGYFTNELEASKAYQNKLKEIIKF